MERWRPRRPPPARAAPLSIFVPRFAPLLVAGEDASAPCFPFGTALAPRSLTAMRPSRRQTQLFPRYWVGGRPSVTVLLVACLTGAFASQWMLTMLDPVLVDDGWIAAWLAVGSESLSGGKWWQFLTFGFLHDNPLHLLANLLLIYFAGREIEPIIGPRQTLSLFALGQIAGGLAHVLAMPAVPLVGASAGAAALVTAFATALPELEVIGHLFFVVPLKIGAKYFGLGLALISATCWITRSFPLAGPAAAFTGCVVGWIATRRLGFGRPFWFQRMIFDHRQREARLQRMPPEQFMAEEMDPILDKIAQSGMQSLTRAERKILERGRAKMDAKRG